jgi:hypothetical protein
MLTERLTISGLALLTSAMVMAQCPTILTALENNPLVSANIVTNFGACPDDNVNDHDAFVEAANYFNDRGGFGTLFIPAGEYIVGRQAPPGGQLDGTDNWIGENNYRAYKHLLDLQNCSTLNIVGELDESGAPASKIRFDDCMTYGVFNPNYTGQGHERFIRSENEPVPALAAQSPFGQMIVLNGCTGVTIRNLELDGNSGKYILGGPNDEGAGIQMHSDGIRLGAPDENDSQNEQITIKNVNAHHFGRDGLSVTNGGMGMDLVIHDCQFDDNGRTGFAWSGGSGVRVENSTFDRNATGRIRSNTRAGLDIEHHNGALLSDASFIDCTFHHNEFAGVTSGLNQSDGNITFEGCSFKSLAARYLPQQIFSPTSYSVHVEEARGLRFTACKFFGPAGVGFNAEACSSSLVDAQQFFECTFSEEDEDYTYHDWRLSDVGTIQAPFMVLGNTISGTRFEKCKFISNCRARFLNLNGAEAPEGCTPCIRDVVIKHCTFLNTGLWADSALITRQMFLLNGGEESISWFSSPINLPNMIRLENGQIGGAGLDYDHAITPFVSNCTDGHGTTWLQGAANDTAIMQDFFEDHPCLPVYPEPQTPREVIGVQTTTPIWEVIDKYPCNKLGKSNRESVVQEAITAVVRNGSLSLQLPGTTQVGLARIYDSTGKTIGQVTVAPGANEWPLHHLAVGSYILHWVGAITPVRFVVTP